MSAPNKAVAQAPFNIAAFLAAVLTNLQSSVVIERQADDSKEMMKDSFPAVQIQGGEGGSFSCIIPLDIVKHFSQNPYRIECITAEMKELKLPVAVVAFTPIEKVTPAILSVTGQPINSQSETLKKIIDGI